jgi:hypothetical protein
MESNFYRVFSARYRHQSRAERRSSGNRTRGRRAIIIGGLRLPANASKPFHLTYRQVRAYADQICELLDNKDIWMMDPDGQQLHSSADLPWNKRKAEVAAQKQAELEDVPEAEEPTDEEVIDEQVEDAAEEAAEEPEEPPEEPKAGNYDLSPLDGSVAVLVEYLEDIDEVDHVHALMAAEEIGKTRKSAIAAMKERIAELEE